MGNTQSIEVPRRQSHRLSKPKTGSHATAGLLNPNGFLNSTKRISSTRLNASLPNPMPVSSPMSSPTTSFPPSESSADPEQSIGEEASAVSVQQKEEKRRSPFRSRSSQGTRSSRRRNSSSGPGSRAADKLGRANSMTYESTIAYHGQTAPDSWPQLARSHTSWNYDLTSYEGKRLLNLVEEPAFEHATGMSENKMSVVTATTWKSSNPTNPAASAAPISRASSDVSLYMPVRRRSVIQTPGVATRSSSTRNSPAPLSRPNFRHSHPPTPSLSRQYSFESHRSGVHSMPPRMPDAESVPRVVTPCEADYQSIGAFKLGSLRITNGAASPVSPEMDKSRKNDGLPVSQDGSRGAGAADYFSRARLQASETLLEAEATHTAPTQLSPIHSNVSSSGSANAPADVAQLAPEYLADLAFSPFSLEGSEPTSPKLQATSKHTALEDQLFDDEAQPEYSPVEVLDVRLDPNAKAQHEHTTNSDLSSAKAFARTDSGFVSTTSPSSEYSHKPLTKADSGYSSNVSLRSFQQSRTQVAEKELTSSLEKQFSYSSPRRESFQSEAGTRPAAPQRDAPPPPPPKDLLPSSPVRAKANVIQRKSLPAESQQKELLLATPNASSGKTRLIPSPISSARSSEAGPKSPDSIPRTPVSARSAKSDNSGSALSIGSASHKPSKLQRLLSGARRPATGPLTVHTTHVTEKTGIPSIPHDVEHKLHEHTGLFPITTKRLALKSRASLDTLKTIFSVGSVEASLDAVTSVSVVEKVPEAETEDGPTAKGSSWRNTLHAMPSSVAHVAAHVMPRKPIARKPLATARHEAVRETEQVTKAAENESILPVEAELATYNSVRDSLGNNPYDAAVLAMAGSQKPSGRTMSLTVSVERDLTMMRLSGGAGSTSAMSAAELPSPSLPSPLLARAMFNPEKKAKTPPPVIMVTRRPASLRVPPPLRATSSATGLRRQAISRRASRESLRSYPSAQLPSLAQKTSRESIRSNPSYQQSVPPPPIPPVNIRRSLSSPRQHQAPRSPQHKTPNWEVQTDHDMPRQSPRASSNGVNRHNSLPSSNPSQAGYGIQRPASAQAWQVRTGQPPLRHRSSYDGYSFQQGHVQRGHPPSMSNGYVAPAKPNYDPSTDPSAGQWDQSGRYPPHVPRGHYRNRSMNNGHGASPPFRVLHSYNSPAYRNAPIWG
ncbi:hypothetical protein QBC46DRAFT_440611 [Diplogelasinospora grovesii]|uniref:Proteophosphoglycan ppg4 n=1 Tax=Diplogelasinospora grovesii TaxID=303347 RepID=A0AAN6N420_9PEZI|nr:hypothetical protein QBC46DRAFT_440611 [Diplogelasinospora grovesii]